MARTPYPALRDSVLGWSCTRSAGGKTPEDGVLRLYGRVMFDWRIGAGNQET
ncbi:MAG: hypothetical protein II837_14765 [Treponema sp.]|nr:hypothetical protein [Treponema sp.]